jgi:protein-tyrosine-phosphatase
VAALEGHGATDLAQDVLRRIFQLDLTRHRARRLRSATPADLVLAMDHDALEQARQLGHKGRIALLGDYAGTGEEVEDPFGGTRSDYEACAHILDRLVRAALQRLAAEPDPRD